jgi:hypothetical protein
VPEVKVTANDSNTFKPFNPSEAIGNTAPDLPYIPPPPKDSCNPLVAILVIVVAVVVTVFTAGAAAAALAATQGAVAGAVGGTMAVGTAALTGGVIGATAGATFTLTTAGAMLVGAVAGAAGAAASMAVGSALGQGSFSWRGVAAGAVTGGLTAGASSLLAGSTSSLLVNSSGGLTNVGHAVQGVASYGAGVVGNATAGLDTAFSWNAVAASAVGSVMSANLGGRVKQLEMGGSSGKLMKDFSGYFIDSASEATARRSMGLGSQDWDRLAVDAFGNALGNATVEALTKREYANIRRDFVEEITRSHGVGAGMSAQAMYNHIPFGSNELQAKQLIRDRLSLTSDSSQSQFMDVTDRFLQLAEINGERISDEDRARVIDYWFGERFGTVGPTQQLGGTFQQPTSTEWPSVTDPFSLSTRDLSWDQAQWRRANQPAFLSQYVDEGLEGVGGAALYLGQQIEERPYLKWGLLSLETVMGPALMAGRTAIMASPIGDHIEAAEAALVGMAAERFAEKPGYNADEANRGGVGTLFAVGMATTGLVGVLKKLPSVNSALNDMRGRLEAIGSRATTNILRSPKFKWAEGGVLNGGVPKQWFEGWRIPYVRIETVTDAMRNRFADHSQYLNPLTNRMTNIAEEMMAIDHTVPVKAIAEMRGFRDLTPDQMRAIIHDDVGIGNLELMPQYLNASKGSKIGREPWERYGNIELNQEYVSNLVNRQQVISERIQAQINEYLKANRAGR